VKLGKIGLQETNEAVLHNHKLGVTLPTVTFLEWAAFVNSTKNEKFTSEIIFLMNFKSENEIHYQVGLDERSLTKYLESPALNDPDRVFALLDLVAHSDKKDLLLIAVGGFVFRHRSFGRSVVFIRKFEDISNISLSKKLYGLIIANLEDDFDDLQYEESLDFGVQRKLFDEHNYLALYRLGIVNGYRSAIEFVLSQGQLAAATRGPLRQAVLKYELASGDWELAFEVFKITAELNDQDPYDSVILVQNCPFDKINQVRSLILQYLPVGLPFNDVSVGSLCNRFSRNGQYEEVLAVLEEFSKYCTGDRTILDLYRLAALSNLDRDHEAREVLSQLSVNKLKCNTLLQTNIDQFQT
jgi:hypothetical protein